MVQYKKNAEPIALKLIQVMFQTLGPIMPKAMGSYAYEMWFKPQRFVAPQQELLIAHKADASFLYIDNVRIRLWSWGEGPTVLFIHGWSGRGTQISSFVDVLNHAGFRVLSFDMPGHGQSDGNKTNAYQIVKVIVEIMQSINTLHSVITHSFGGALFGNLYNTQLALKNAVMICPPATIHTALDQFAQTLKLPQSIESYIESQLKKDFGSDVFDKLSLIENAKKMTIPTMIAHDTDDDVVPFKDAQEIMGFLKLGTLYQTNGLGHRKILFEPTVVSKISQFIQAH